MILSDELRNGGRMNCFHIKFIQSDPDRAVDAPVRAVLFGTSDSDIVSAHCRVEVPLTLDRPAFFSMVDTNAEGS